MKAVIFNWELAIVIFMYLKLRKQISNEEVALTSTHGSGFDAYRRAVPGTSLLAKNAPRLSAIPYLQLMFEAQIAAAGLGAIVAVALIKVIDPLGLATVPMIAASIGITLLVLAVVTLTLACVYGSFRK